MHGVSLRVLDMCCGKGGDLFKWMKVNISHVICADLAKVSVEQCQHRYNEILNSKSNNRGFAPIFTAEFIAADCTKVIAHRIRRKRRKVEKQSISRNVVFICLSTEISYK